MIIIAVICGILGNYLNIFSNYVKRNFYKVVIISSCYLLKLNYIGDNVDIRG